MERCRSLAVFGVAVVVVAAAVKRQSERLPAVLDELLARGGERARDVVVRRHGRTVRRDALPAHAHALRVGAPTGAAVGDWAVTSLAACASLTQLTLQKREPPPSAVGCYATGMNAHDRVYPVSGGKYIYGQAPKTADVEALLATLATMDVDSAIRYFKSELGALAVPVNTVKEIAALSSDGVSKTAKFAKKDSGMGWVVETWEPTWFCLDGEPLSCARAPTFSGADAEAILSDLGYSQGQTLGLKQSRAVVPTNWYKWNDEADAQPLKLFFSDDLSKDGLE